MRILRVLGTVLFASILALPLAAQATLGTFTGGDPGEGLDMTGSFVYAVNLGGPGGEVIGDATFTTESTPGVAVTAPATISDWASPQYGSTSNDNNLETIMQGIEWNFDAPVVVSLDTVVGQTYKLQLLFTESCCNRGFDILVDGTQIANDYSPQDYSGITGTPTQGGVVSYTFVATNTTTVITLDGSTDTTHTDHNPILSAFTLEGPDVSITKTTNSPEAAVGHQLTYTIVASNNGPGTATGVTVTDTFPAGITNVTYTSSASGGATGNTASGSGNINDTVTLPSGSSITYTATGTVADTGDISNTATITPPGAFGDTNVGNNAATVRITSVEVVPTVSEWGLLLLCAALAFAGAMYVRR